ncbi:hypothetical protein QU38_01140, partial [Staphylococcus aureus]
MHAPGNRGLCDAQDRRGLAMGQLLPGDQDRGVAIGRRQAGDRALHPERIVQIAPGRAACKAGQHREPLGDTAERPAAAMHVATGVEHDSAQPGGELRVAAKTVDPFDERAAHVLCDVLGIGTRAGQLPGQA